MSAPEPGDRGPFRRVANFYDDLVDRYGHDPRACDYGRPASQQVKFQMLTEACDFTGRRILDVGCGFADYADYLGERFAGVEYTGIDLSPRMISEARRLRPGLELRRANVLEDGVGGPFDVVTANGIFYLLGASAPPLMRELVARMFELATSVVVFNSLSTWAPAREPGEFYADPLETLQFCRTFTSRVVLRHDYLPHDFTVYLYRDTT